MSTAEPHVGNLHYVPPQPESPVEETAPSSVRSSSDSGRDGFFFENVAEGIQKRDRARIRRQVIRYGSFIIAIINCLCAGSITAYSLYGHLFQSHLRYTQVQVNIVSIAAELSLYLPVPIFGYLCDRYGPRWPSFVSAVMFGLGYFLAAFTYKSGPPPSADGSGWPFGVMVLAFVCVGVGTSAMYLAAVSTCAKNFGRGKHKGLALALPLAAFGLSGLWLCQVGSRLLYEREPDGTRGDVDVYRFFLFLAGLLLGTGLLATFTLKVADEEEMIEEAVDELERSGFLEDSALFDRGSSSEPHRGQRSYGTLGPTADHEDTDSEDRPYHPLLDHKRDVSEDARRKTWLLNAETRLFLSDSTMWWFAAGFFLVTGPGEAFINNLGTIIGTLETPPPFSSDPASPLQPPPTNAATQVSIVALTSTLTRIVTGTLSDLLAPVTSPHQHRRGPNSLTSSLASLPDPLSLSPSSWLARIRISRVAFLITFSLLLSIGFALLASGQIQNRAGLFWIVSALVGSGYGACFSLVPIIISVVWGVENFGTNWGIVAIMPAFGATVWSTVYATVYQTAARKDALAGMGKGDDILCYGRSCYAPSFWAMCVGVWMACGFWLWAWRGKGGWNRRGIAV